MRLFAVLVIFVFLHPAYAYDYPFVETDWLKEGLCAQLQKFKRVTFVPHPEDSDILAANCETALDWWSSLRVFHRTGDKIDWIAALPPAYDPAHYIISVRWQYLDSFKLWVLEVFDSTHRGNGSLSLFTLEGQNLRLLFNTPAVGHFWESIAGLAIPQGGEARFVGRHLDVDYRILNPGKHESVVLTGSVAVFDQDGVQLSTRPYKETFEWDSDKGIFLVSNHSHAVHPNVSPREN